MRACSASRRAMTAAWPAELQPLLELVEALERERQLGLHGLDPVVLRRDGAHVGAQGLRDLAEAGQLGAQDVEAARGGLGDVADLAQLSLQRGGALVGGVDRFAGLEHVRAEAVELRTQRVEPLAAGPELVPQRRGALIDGGRGARSAPPPACEPRRRPYLALEAASRALRDLLGRGASCARAGRRPRDGSPRSPRGRGRRPHARRWRPRRRPPRPDGPRGPPSLRCRPARG